MSERLVRTKVVQLQSWLKEAAVALIKQMDVNYTAKVKEITAAQRSVQASITSTRHMIDSARTFLVADGANSGGVLDAVSTSVASISFITLPLLWAQGVVLVF